VTEQHISLEIGWVYM